MEKTLTIDELEEVFRAGLATLLESKQADYADRFSSNSKLSNQQLMKLTSKMEAGCPTFYLGSVNAWFLLGLEAMEDDGYPLDAYWSTLVTEYEMKGPEDEPTDTADAFGKVREFLQEAQLIRK